MRTDRRARYEVMNMAIQAVIYDDRGVLERIEQLYQFPNRFQYEDFIEEWHGADFIDFQRHSCGSFEYGEGFYAILFNMSGKEVYRTRLWISSMDAMTEGRAMCRLIEEDQE